MCPDMDLDTETERNIWTLLDTDPFRPSAIHSSFSTSPVAYALVISFKFVKALSGRPLIYFTVEMLFNIVKQLCNLDSI